MRAQSSHYNVNTSVFRCTAAQQLGGRESICGAVRARPDEVKTELNPVDNKSRPTEVSCKKNYENLTLRNNEVMTCSLNKKHGKSVL